MPVRDNSALRENLLRLRQEHDDLRVVSGTAVDPSGFTLLSTLRNEMYFLPAFLDHYRRLGVERFVFLNDRSYDGSLEYLLGQPDTVVVESDRRYGERYEFPPPLDKAVGDFRITHLWRALLHDKFARDRWALQVDLDEFVHLPEGMIFPELVARLECQEARLIYGVMLDVYPKDIAALAGQEGERGLDVTATWYFDGEKHLRLRTGRFPKIVHPGARARLYHAYGVDRLYPGITAWTRPLKTRFGFRVMRINPLQKATLLKWDSSAFFSSPHKTDLAASETILLPIQHFRFCGAVYRKIELALREKSYRSHSAGYSLLSELLKTMEEKNGSFLYRNSRPLEQFEDFTETKNAFGL